jgi:2,3-bisphosphoglycerate-dependent phosphoglycerate mutase
VAVVILVRNAMPVVQPGVHPVRWRLDELGRSAVASLGQALPDDLAGVLWSSHEARGQETAEQLIDARGGGLELRLDHDLREVGRPTAWSSTYAEDLASYFRNGAGEGWEPATAVLTRVSDVVDRALREAGGAPVVVVTHGLALSLYVGATCGVRPAGFLQSLLHPDAWLLDVEAGRLERLDPDDGADESLLDDLDFDFDGA